MRKELIDRIIRETDGIGPSYFDLSFELLNDELNDSEALQATQLVGDGAMSGFLHEGRVNIEVTLAYRVTPPEDVPSPTYEESLAAALEETVAMIVEVIARDMQHQDTLVENSVVFATYPQLSVLREENSEHTRYQLFGFWAYARMSTGGEEFDLIHQLQAGE